MAEMITRWRQIAMAGGVLFFLFVLFVKHMPSVSMTEMKETLDEGEAHGA